MPTPNKNESKDKFLERCMGDDEANQTFPDNKQRYAFCNSQWDNKDKKNMDNKIERRVYPVTEIRINRGVDGQGDKLIGYAAVFDRLSEDLGGFREKIQTGAFKRTIKGADVRALFNHDENYVLGRTKSGTLKLSEDSEGLRMENTPPDTSWAKDLKVSVDRGDISQMSFGFRTISDKWEKKNDENIRTLEEVELFDVSVVTFPAYHDTTVALRSMEQWNKENNNPSDETVQDEHETEPDQSYLVENMGRKRQLELKQKQILLEE